MTVDPNAPLGYERMPMAVNKGRAHQKRFAKFLAKEGWEIESTGATQQALGFGKQNYILRRPITAESKAGRKIIAERAKEAQKAATKAERRAKKAEERQQTPGLFDRLSGKIDSAAKDAIEQAKDRFGKSGDQA